MDPFSRLSNPSTWLPSSVTLSSPSYRVLRQISSFSCDWYDLIWYDMIWYDTVWYDMIWYDMIQYDMIWYDMIQYDMICKRRRDFLLPSCFSYIILYYITVYKKIYDKKNRKALLLWFSVICLQDIWNPWKPQTVSVNFENWHKTTRFWERERNR